MTHDQKPESAEFRTREDQIETMTVHYMEAGFPINAARRLARDGVAEAEARGAAEQRRKDEPEFEKIVSERDDAEDFIREMAQTVLGGSVEWSNVYGFQNALNDVSERIFFLEKDTANVAALEAERDKWKQQAQYETDVAEEVIQEAAALEARVKELKAHLGAMKNGTIRQVIHSPLRHFKPEDRA